MTKCPVHLHLVQNYLCFQKSNISKALGVCRALGPWTPSARRACIRPGPHKIRGLRPKYTWDLWPDYMSCICAHGVHIGGLQKISYPPTNSPTQRFRAALWMFDCPFPFGWPCPILVVIVHLLLDQRKGLAVKFPYV